MKRLCLFGSLFWCLTACHSTPTTPTADPESLPGLAPSSAPAALVDEAPPSPAAEYIEADQLTLNGQPHQELSTPRLVGQLGRPDRIARGAVECGSLLDSPTNSPLGDYWYYGRTRYEVSGSRAVLVRADATTATFRGQLGALRLTRQTTLEDVRHLYPQAAQQAAEPAAGRSEQVLSLPFYHKGEPTDASLLLIFAQGHLQAIEFFLPC